MCIRDRDVIAVDELGGESDIEALNQLVSCGIRTVSYTHLIYYTHLMQSRHRFPSLILYILTVVIHFM